ncbi:MAG: hypothetical protein E7409_03650 [Ruminococcaceae bacterium]|nr:hypothetical protein [Oscillospiraceae bacterium]
MKYCVLNPHEYEKQYGQKLGEISPFDAGIPLLDVEDKIIEQVYYYRWNVFCKHIRKTPEGHVITEFYPSVPWAKKYNTINCPAGHHLYEGRWLHNQEYINDYATFWFEDPEAQPRQYSFWVADAIYNVCKVTDDFSIAEKLYEKLKENYAAWEKSHGMENGLFYQIDDRDGMEYSAGGSGCRPTINSYMYADALALSRMAQRMGKGEDAKAYAEKAADLKKKINSMLWNDEAQFFETLAEEKNYQFSGVREEVGFVPWYFNVPDSDKSVAWKFLMDDEYFWAPYGPTTTEQICPDFMKEFNHECLWNGPSWPFATSQTATALGNLLCNYKQTVMTNGDYYKLLHTYANSQFDVKENGERVPYVDENLDPFTGEWIARAQLRKMEKPPGGADRGEDYNHSTFCDLVLNGLVGIRPREGEGVLINPLFDEDDLAYLCADGILYHGKYICVLWDRTGKHYGKGHGLRIYCDGEEILWSSKLVEVEI